MTWFQLCELAQCQPDFQVVFELSETRAVYWLRARLLSRDHDIAAADIRAALEAFQESK